MVREEAELYMASNSPHIHQPVTGFLSLQDEERLKVSFIKKQLPGKEVDLPHEHCLIAYTSGKTIVFDMADGYNFKPGFHFAETLDQVDYYFKRSFSEEKNREWLGDVPQIRKVYPYGFNYYVSHRKIPVTPVTCKSIMRYLRAYLRHETPQFVWSSDIFAKEPIEISKPPRIVFCTRLWNESSFSANELEHINGMRIELVRRLKQTYGKNFVGGVSNCSLAQKICPDIILSDDICAKSNYLRIMQGADICVGSIGLHESIGWKTGEYIAASKAIVNEKFVYEVPGNFQEGVNYLPYTTADECMWAVDFLYKNPDEIKRMEQANWKYYNDYEAPKKLIENALQISRIFPK